MRAVRLARAELLYHEMNLRSETGILCVTIAANAIGRPPDKARECSGEMTLIRESGASADRGDRSVCLEERSCRPVDSASPDEFDGRAPIVLAKHSRGVSWMDAGDRTDI